MSRPMINEKGKKHGYWRVIAFCGVKHGNARWLCECTNCGAHYPVNGFALRNGRSKHCRKCNSKGLD